MPKDQKPEAQKPEAQKPDNYYADQIGADDDEAFSDLGGSIDTDITSLTSSIRNHVYENGRRYHSLSAGTYSLPNDEAEQERLDILHHAVGMMLEGNLQVVQLPKKLNRVLDVGTGTGIWAIAMADQHPEAIVIGVDLSPIQPSWVPPNCIFEVDDIEKPWMWKEPFDFINSANVAPGIRDWPLYAKRIYDNLTPGGVVQLHESSLAFHCDDDTIPKGGALEEYSKKLLKAAEMAGIHEKIHELEGYLDDAGFSDVRVVVKKLPLSPWAKDPQKKELGMYGMAVAQEGLRSYGLGLFTRQLGMPVEEATALCDRALNELKRRSVHAYAALWFVEGRKPQNRS